jgi:hypothetical protein
LLPGRESIDVGVDPWIGRFTHNMT